MVDHISNPGLVSGPENPPKGRPSTGPLLRVAAYGVLALWVLAIVWAVVTPEPGWYDYKHSFNERYYSEVAQGERVDPYMPPGFVTFAIGDSVQALRLVSIAAVGLLTLVVYAFMGARRALLVATLPWVLVWGTRAQTDMAMASLAWIGVILATKAPLDRFMGGLSIGLSSYVKPTGLLAAAGIRDWKAALGVALGVAPLAVWLTQNWGTAIGFHSGSSALFGNWALNLVGALIGAGGAWLLIRRDVPTQFLLPTLLFAAFAFVKAPIAHEYYLLPAVIGLALIVDVERRQFPLALVVNLLLGALVFLSHAYAPVNGGPGP